MIRFVDECVCCDLPCINCGRKNVERTFCDWCDNEIYDKYYDIDGEDICSDCVMEKFIKEHFNSSEKRRAYFQYAVRLDENMDEKDVADWFEDYDKKSEKEQLGELYNEEVDLVGLYLGIKVECKNGWDD